ncbi:cell wall protein RBR3-like isoform X2 [Asterias rubens]|uniref:cell wall protein RBR3-like isoform X2 n=1 Tax=Asterias rubens TaxID=7604 RepID=UPI0014559A77|nr:cell wall protein RBR3-like isoform X2 [Asterias rubens]
MTSLRPFNTSTKESHSLKLRNSQLSSKESERLDTDNMKMEQRLKELKLTMGRQKQERDSMHSNGVIWSSGKPGAITTHGSDLMRKEPSKPSNSKGKPRKIRVLKDTPIEVPKRPSLAASLSKRSPPKLKGPACGQCEEKVVALTCMECGENYCTSCFAKFHLKGALKNHRSLPYQSNSSSNSSSLDSNNGMTSSPKSSVEGLPPRPSSASRRTTTSTDTSNEDGIKTVPVTIKDPSERTGGLFFEGNFSEEESALSFAQALAEWRAGKDADSSAPSQTKDLKKESATSGTSTEPQPMEQVEIQFRKDTSITYADKLLIKKHRRTELSPMSSPREETGGSSSRQEGTLPLTNGQIGAESDDENELQEEHKRYAGIFAQSKSSDEPRLESALSIVDVTEASDTYIAEMESSYNIQEVREPDSDMITTSNPHIQEASLVPPASEPSLKEKSDDPSTTARSISSARVVSSQQKQRRADSSTKPARTVSTPLKSKVDSKPVNQQQRETPKLDTPTRFSSARPTQRVKSSQEKNQIAKSKSANVALNRKSRTQDVAGLPERTTPSSEIASGRISSKEDESGRGSSMGLTSTPSGMLLMTSQLTRDSQHHYKAGLGDFFLAGLGGDEGDAARDDDTQRGVTTTTDKLPTCSYTGTMPAWRPDSSLATPTLGDSLQPYSPSPPAKSGRQSQRSSGKTRSLKGAQPAKSAPEADNTISFVLSEHLPGRKSTNGNKNGVADDKRLQSRQMREPDRSSSRIEVDGDDMSVYDTTGKDYNEMEDKETLEKLTWELASQSGRITADGCLTSMNLPDADEDIYRENSFSQDAELGIVDDAGLGSGLSTPFDFLTGESLSREVSDEGEDMEEMELQRFTAEVQALT